MKKVIPLFCWVVLLMSSCSKSVKIQQPLDSGKPEVLKNVDFLKSATINHVTGKMTIEYESGKVVVKNLPKDTIKLRPHTESGTDGIIATDNVFDDPAAQGTTSGGAGSTIGGVCQLMSSLVLR